MTILEAKKLLHRLLFPHQHKRLYLSPHAEVEGRVVSDRNVYVGSYSVISGSMTARGAEEVTIGRFAAMAKTRSTSLRCTIPKGPIYTFHFNGESADRHWSSGEARL